jgi:cell division protein FtsL
MAALAPEPATRAAAVPVPQARPRPRPRAERRPQVASGVAWIVVIGALLAGVVFMNVAVLRLNMQLDKQGRERTQLRADVASLASQVSSAQAAARIQAQARRDLGVVPADASHSTFIRLPAK